MQFLFYILYWLFDTRVKKCRAVDTRAGDARAVDAKVGVSQKMDTRAAVSNICDGSSVDPILFFY